MLFDQSNTVCCCLFVFLFFFQAEDGIRDAQESRGLGDVYKRQTLCPAGTGNLQLKRSGRRHAQR